MPEVRLTDAKLAAWAKVAFQTTVPNATVRYQRSGDAQARQVTASEKLVLPPGQYDFTAEAPGYQKYDTGKVNLPSGFDGSIPLKLNSVPDYQFLDPGQITHDGPEWLKAKDSHAFVHLKPGFLHETLIFAKPGRNFLGANKKVEWRIEAADNSARVEYVLDGQKLQRRFVVGEAGSDLKETKVDVAAAATQATSLSVYVQVDGPHVQISNAKGVILDDYMVPPKVNFSGVRISIKTDSQFVVRDK
jgi:hypothetical protein